jgi:hypothetical protein
MTLTRREWSAVVEELELRHRDDAPPGLIERISALLAATPAAWPDQACRLELSDLEAVELVRVIVRQMHEHSAEPGFHWQEDASIAEAENILRQDRDRDNLN